MVFSLAMAVSTPGYSVPKRSRVWLAIIAFSQCFKLTFVCLHTGVGLRHVATATAIPSKVSRHLQYTRKNGSHYRASELMRSFLVFLEF